MRNQEMSSTGVEHLQVRIELLLRGVKYLTASLEALEVILEEYLKLKAAISKARTPLDYEALVRAIVVEHPMLGDALARSEVERYELGRLWVRATNEMDRGTLLLMSTILKEFIERYHEVPMRVRIKNV